MGQVVNKISRPLQECGNSVASVLSGRKRKRSPDSSDSSDEALNNDSLSPKKKKLLTTTQYIYQALFKEQANSDIAVMALGKVWNLHKIYLSQSPYFYSMFNGSWKEAGENFVHVKILDDRITVEALEAVFGSMYSDEIEIDPKGVVSILATATLFNLEGIIDKCAEVMIENINVETVIDYYEAGCEYGCLNVKNVSFKWLLTNLLCIYTKYKGILREISVDLMTDLISSPDLYVMQTEFSLYTLVRMWMYLLLHPNYDPDILIKQQKEEGDVSPNDVITSSFINRTDKRSFLTTSEGQQFIRPFLALRTQYLTNHHMDLKIVLNDNIIPKEWLHNHVLSHWNSTLRIDHIKEDGPQNVEPDVFYKNCMRCGRLLLEPGYQKWRWTGFNFGLDLILIADSHILSIRRHHRNEHERLLSLQSARKFMIRVSICSINAQRQPVFTQTSDIISLNLEKNEEKTLMILDSKLVHPLLISVNMLVVPPTSQTFKENILANEDANAAIPISEIGTNCLRSASPTNAQDVAVCVAPTMLSSTPLNSPSWLLSARSSPSVASRAFAASVASSEECV